MDINLKTLIGKLNDTTRAAATRAAGICVGFGQYEVDIEHLFLALLEQPASDFVVAARAVGDQPDRLRDRPAQGGRAPAERQQPHAGVLAPPAGAVRARLADRLAGPRSAGPGTAHPQRPPAAGAAGRTRPGPAGPARVRVLHGLSRSTGSSTISTS
jgi:hypothetical protein